MNKTKRFFEPVLKIPVHGVKIILVQVIYSGITVFNIFYIKYIVELLEKGEMLMINKAIIIYILACIFYLIVTLFTRDWGWAMTYFPHRKMVHRQYMLEFNNLDNTYIENIGTGKAISILSKGIDTWSRVIIEVIQTPVKLIISLVSAFIIMYEIGILYILFFLVIFVLVHLIVFKLNEIAIMWRRKRRDSMIEYDKQIVKMIMSKFEILQNNKIKKEIQVLDNISDESNAYNLKLNMPMFMMFTIPNFTFFIITTLIFFGLTSGLLSYSSIISIFLILSLLKENMQGSIMFFKNFTSDFSEVEKLWDLFDNGKKISGLDGGFGFEYKKGDISIKELCFSYNDLIVFENLNLEIKGNQMTAFVGISGSGKTTLVKLISGFLNSNSGNILVDGQNLKDLKLKSYYKHIGYLTQEPSVFDGSILDNLIYGLENENINKEIIREAIMNAKCEFIYEFSDGLNTQIGEKGVRLSGGQRQRLAIAKLFIKNPNIIILDEPTSALDSFSEECIRESFEKLFKNRTVIIIAHRLQTVKTTSDIIVFEGGKVIERGTHEMLLKENGYYKKMLDLQSGF